ncbi:hypothetical protein ACQEU3_46660 [Spirillospora sp. CA-253888]
MMDGIRIEGATAFQVQTSKDGDTWVPRQPGEPHESLSPGGDHWFTDRHQAWVAAINLRNNLMWSDVRLVGRDAAGRHVGEQNIE